jgi:PKD repeat protein
MDTGGLKTNSNEFEVSVTPVNDPPFWEEIIPDLKLDEDTSKEAWLDLDNFGADIEENFLDYRLISQSDQVNISININAENKITIIPKPNYFGTSNATIQVFESGNKEFYANYTFDITVLPINDPPVISPISDQIVNEDQWLNFTITATDPDFDVNFSFKSNISRANFNIEPYTGKLSFHPTNDDVGILFVNISVKDEGALKDYDEFKITINNVNDPPTKPVIASPEYDAKFKTKELVEFQAGICQDIDIGDIITYSWDFDFSNGIQQDKLGREVNHTYVAPGKYKVTLTISDGTVHKSTFILVNITKSGTGPTNGGEVTNGNGDGQKDSDYLLIAMIVIVIIIVLVLITSGFLLLRKKRKSILNKYIDEIEQAYDWARTNPSVGKEKLSSIKTRLPNELKEGRLDSQSYNLLENKLNDYMNLLGMRVAGAPPGQIPTAQPYKVSPTAEPGQVQISQSQQSPPSLKVEPIEPAPSPQTQQSTSQTTHQPTQQSPPQKKQVVKCFNCGNFVTVTLALEGEPTIMHCPKCGETGTI